MVIIKKWLLKKMTTERLGKKGRVVEIFILTKSTEVKGSKRQQRVTYLTDLYKRIREQMPQRQRNRKPAKV